MPLINVRISTKEVENPKALLTELSKELANLTGKPEKFVMSLLQVDVPMTFGGTEEPCCYVEIKSIGALKPSKMSESFCKLIESRTNIPSNRIYIGFEDVEANLTNPNFHFQIELIAHKSKFPLLQSHLPLQVVNEHLNDLHH